MTEWARRYWIGWLLLAGIGALLLWTLTPARAAAASCGPYHAMIDGLLKTYGETPHWIGTMGGGQYVVTFFVNTETGSWTVAGQKTADLMCIIQSGENWTDAPAAMRDKKPEAPAKES